MELSRRNFVKAAAGATAGTAAIAALNSAPALADEPTSNESVTSDADPIAPLELPSSWDSEADIVVIGSGGGLAAAVHAAEAGASVILIEKNSETGGTSKEASIWVAPGTIIQEENGQPDISESQVESAIEAAPFKLFYPEYIEGVTEASKAIVSWSTDEGFEWQLSGIYGGVGPVYLSPAGSEEGGMTARAMMYIYQFMDEKFLEYGGEERLSTTLEGLVMDDGAVVGVMVSDIDGNESYIKANKGVLLATGGIGANRDMLAKYAPTCLTNCKFSTCGWTDTGDGIRMGVGAGAEVDGYDKYDVFDGGIDGVDWNTYMYISAVQIARQPWLGITRYGERYPYIEDNFNAAGLQLNGFPEHEGFIFFDDNFEEYGPTFKQQMCRRLIDASTMPDEGRVPATWVNPEWYDGVRDSIADGLIPSADTFEELAEKLGLDPEKVVAAVNEWNAICEEGHDPEGKMPDEYLYPLAQPPYYGMALGSFVFSTHAGLAVNGSGAVVDRQGNAIPGLYASGCTVGTLSHTNSDSCFGAASAWLAADSMLNK